MGNGKCNYINSVDWEICGLKRSEHQVDHDFVKRPPHKTHIAKNYIKVKCGYYNVYVYDIVVPETTDERNLIRALTRNNAICKNCLKVYIFEMFRDEYID